MEVKMSIFKRIENKRSLQVIFCVVSMMVIIGVYILAAKRIKDIRISELETTTDYNILVGFDEVIRDGENLQLSGWGLRLESVIEQISLLLMEIDGEGEIVLSTKLYERLEIENYFNPFWEFGEVGFETSIKENRLKQNTCYEIFVTIDYDVNGIEKRKKISSGQYLYNGEMYRYNPEKFIEPEITDERLAKVIQEGELRGYDGEARIWIYVYENQIYFIANPEFGSMEENKIGVPIMPRTSRTELLPEKRIQDGTDHLGYFYENKEYVREGILPYQVVTVELPQEYPITYIHMGLHDKEESKWIRYFLLPLADWRP